MSLTQVYTYDTASDFTFDSSKITLASGSAKLQLTTAALEFTETFASSTGFTYDSTKAEFTGGVVQQLATNPTNSICAATYTSSVNLSWGVTNLTGTLNGSPTITSNKLVCTGSQGVSYTDSSIGDGGTGAIKFKYTPNYTTSPPTNINMITLDNGTNNNDKMLLLHSPSGNTIRITAYNSTGGSVTSALAIGSAFTPTAGTEYEIELDWDTTTGVVYLFIDGVLQGSVSPGAWTRGTSATTLTVGAYASTYNRAEASYADVILFNALEHSSGYTPGYTLEETLYVESTVELPEFAHSGDGSIISLSGLVTVETNSPLYTIQLDQSGTYLYWDGAAWSTSDGTSSQANTAATFNANIGSLDVNGDLYLQIKAVFTGSNNKQNIDNLKIQHVSNNGYYTDNPSIVYNSPIGVDGFDQWLENSTISGSDLIKYTINFGGTEYYWDGSAWSASDGTYAQANTDSEITTNIAALTTLVSSGGTFKPVAYLHSNDGTTTPELITLTVGYSFFGSAVSPDNTIVYGYVYNCSTARANVTLTFNSNMHTTDGLNNILFHSSTQTTGSNGYFEISLPKTSHIPAAFITMTVTDTDAGSATVIKKYKLDVTAASTAEKFETLLV